MGKNNSTKVVMQHHLSSTSPTLYL